MTLINYQHRQFNITLTGRSVAAYMLRIRYPAWQDFRELERTLVTLPPANRIESLGINLFQIKDIPVTIKDDVVYLYVGSTSTLRDHNVTVNMQWVKNLPSLEPYLQ
jgi:hypothetical protein